MKDQDIIKLNSYDKIYSSKWGKYLKIHQLAVTGAGLFQKTEALVYYHFTLKEPIMAEQLTDNAKRLIRAKKAEQFDEQKEKVKEILESDDAPTIKFDWKKGNTTWKPE